ncbi:MAG: hypothetical protein AAF648_12840 [Pseudomonadota bacterium]
MTRILWIGASVLWCLFTYWYTNTAGPLQPEEIDAYLDALRSREDGSLRAGSDGVDEASMRRFLEADDGGQFIMVNLLDLNDSPPTVPGADPGESAASLLGRYMEFMYPALFRRACHPIWAGRVAGPAVDLIGVPDGGHWEQAALMRYRSRRDLMDIASNPEFAGRHDFKMAALTKTIAVPTVNQLSFSDPRWLLASLLVTVCALLTLLRHR